MCAFSGTCNRVATEFDGICIHAPMGWFSFCFCLFCAMIPLSQHGLDSHESARFSEWFSFWVFRAMIPPSQHGLDLH